MLCNHKINTDELDEFITTDLHDVNEPSKTLLPGDEVLFEGNENDETVYIIYEIRKAPVGMRQFIIRDDFGNKIMTTADKLLKLE